MIRDRPKLVSAGDGGVGHLCDARGAVGGGGLGDLAIRYGYQRFDARVMLMTIVILIALVQMIQYIGDYWVKRLTHQ